MTVKFGFYDSLNGDRLYNADDINTFFEGVFTDGVFEFVGSKLIVEPSPGTMNIMVRDGRAYFNKLWIRNTSTLTLPIEPSHVIYDRIDIVILEFDSSITVRENSIRVITGIPSATPIPPTLINTSSVHQYALAHIYVAASASEIESTDITNKIGTVSTPYAKSLLSEPVSGGTTPGLFEARLSLSSTIPITIENTADQDTLYLHPFKGNRVSLYNGSEWAMYTLLSPISLSLNSLPTSSRPYDIFVYDNGGSLELNAVSWTNFTTRTTELAILDGVYVKSGSSGYKYIGTIYIDSTKKSSMEVDSINVTTKLRRHVWNYYNRLWSHARHVSTASHTYTSSTYRKWNNNDALTHEVVIGVLEEDITAFAGGNVSNSGNIDVAINWTSGGGELVDLFVSGTNGISAFTGGGLRRHKIVNPGLIEVAAVQAGSTALGTGTFNSGVLDVALNM